MVYSWTATGPVIYDFHSEPEGAPPGYAESFDKAQAPAANGTYTAPFSGIHGWFWENPGTKLVTITLDHRRLLYGRTGVQGQRQLVPSAGRHPSTG